MDYFHGNISQHLPKDVLKNFGFHDTNFKSPEPLSDLAMVGLITLLCSRCFAVDP